MANKQACCARSPNRSRARRARASADEAMKVVDAIREGA
jgi:hypothetical protein